MQGDLRSRDSKGDSISISLESLYNKPTWHRIELQHHSVIQQSKSSNSIHGSGRCAIEILRKIEVASRMRNPVLILAILLIFAQCGQSGPIDSKDSKGQVSVVPQDVTKSSSVKLETSNSEKKEVKVKDAGIAGQSSAEKLGTSSTIPIGYATADGIIYDAPLTSGDYAALGAQPNLFVHQNYQGGGQFPGGLHEGHGQFPTHGQHGIGHEGGGFGGGPVPGYGGVAYAGHGPQLVQPVGHGQYLQGIGGHGGIGHTKLVQNPVHIGAIELQKPFSPYGHGGVVYMGNGLIPEHIAGVKQVGPVLPPAGYQHHENVVIKKNSEVDPLGNVHTSGVALKNSVGIQQGFGHNPYAAPGYHVQGHHHEAVHQFPHQVSYDTASRVKGVDAYGNVVKDVKVRQRYETAPGLGYNGLQNDVIAHTDQAIIEHHQQQHHYQRPYDGRGFSNPDPYYNNQHYPDYYRGGGAGHAMTLLTTGPNRYYQGKNPIGVYERYHRLG